MTNTGRQSTRSSSRQAAPEGTGLIHTERQTAPTRQIPRTIQNGNCRDAHTTRGRMTRRSSKPERTLPNGMLILLLSKLTLTYSSPSLTEPNSKSMSLADWFKYTLLQSLPSLPPVATLLSLKSLKSQLVNSLPPKRRDKLTSICMMVQ